MSNSRYADSIKMGLVAEDEFATALDKRGIAYKKASRQEQFKHIDFHTNVAKDGQPDDWRTVDVKAMKRVNRSDNNAQNEFVWVEFANVRGNPGWLRSEHLDYIAFQREDSFLMIARHVLLREAERLCDLKNITNQSKEALYRGYQRQGRKDLIAMIKMSDIESLPHKMLPK